jgi:hypothetical protein
MKRAIIWLSVFLLAAVGLLVVVFLLPNSQEWDETVERIETLKRQAEVRSTSRAVLIGDPVPGNAWDEYEIAFKETETWNEARLDQLYYEYVSDFRKMPDRQKAKKTLVSHATVLTHLHLGAQRAGGRAISESSNKKEVAVRRLYNIAIANARIAEEEGRTQEALTLLLDTAALAKDLSVESPYTNGWGIFVYSSDFAELRHLILSGKLTKPQLQDLSSKLALIEHDFPELAPMFWSAAIEYGTQLIAVADGKSPEQFGMEWERAAKSDWRFQVFPRKTMAESFKEVDSYTQRVLAMASSPYVDLHNETVNVGRDSHRSRNPLTQRLSPTFSSILISHHYALAHLRLLRAAAILLGTGQFPSIPDPFGDKLLHTTSAGKSKIWSVGTDGINQNGTGEWGFGEDVVLTIP